MSKNANISFTCVIAVLLTLIIMGEACGSEYYPMSCNWSFQNYSYLGFGQATNFTDAPHLGLPSDNSLMCYWNFDEGSGVVVNGLSGNNSNGCLYGGTWGAG